MAGEHYDVLQTKRLDCLADLRSSLKDRQLRPRQHQLKVLKFVSRSKQSYSPQQQRNILALGKRAYMKHVIFMQSHAPSPIPVNGDARTKSLMINAAIDHVYPVRRNLIRPQQLLLGVLRNAYYA